MGLVLAVLLFLLGLAGTVLPLLPGVILIYAGMLLYGFLTDFTSLGVLFFVQQGIAVLFVFSLDYVAAAMGTRRLGGSKLAAWGAALGILPGILLLGPLGIIAGPFLGAVIAELLTGKQPDAAVRVGFGTLLGLAGGTILKLVTEVLMITWFFMNI